MEYRHKLGVEDMAGHLAPHGACTMFSTRALKNVGGYSESVSAQDGWDLWYKLFNRIGAASLNIPIFYYRQHGESMSRDSKRLLDARSGIFKRISKGLEGDYGITCIAIIPVRESYPNFENVPYREFDGHSLLEKAILVAARSDKVNDVVVSSESQNVLDYSKRLEDEGKVPKHLRLKRSTNTKMSRDIPIQSFMLEAGDYYENIKGFTPDVITFLNLHAVCRQTKHIDTVLNVLRITESDSVVSVQEEREPIFSHGENGLNLLNPGRFQDLTFDRERLYHFNGSIISTWWQVLKTHGVFGEKIGYVEMTSDESIQVKTSDALDFLNLKNK
jgi:CMP-N-acetylneuraminic acid synthetase